MKYIRLDDLKEWREDYIRSGKAKSYDDMTALQVFINNVADRPSGEWLKDKHKNIWDMVVGCYRCSNCGIKAIDHSLIMDTKGLKFCPNCGARMKGADDE